MVWPELERDHQLDIQDVLCPVELSQAEGRVVLEREADHVRHRILGGLGQSGLVGPLGFQRMSDIWVTQCSCV